MDINKYVSKYTGAEVDAAIEKALNLPKQGSTAIPDFAQNDPTAADYIKNRPFYSEEIVPFTWDGNIDDHRVSDTKILAWTDAPSDPKQLIGATIKVVTDGTESEVKITACMTVAEYEASGGEVEGAIVLTDAGTVAGLPGVSYVIALAGCLLEYVYDATAGGVSVEGLWHTFGYDSNTSTMTSYISEINQTVCHKINSKFMPEGYGYDSDKIGVVDVFLSVPIVEEPGEFSFIECPIPEIGAMYRISIEGGTKSVDQ